ncbi:MAG: asparagine synthase (glutamine-hydrolyzing), partial [Gammaproteobacteria bacterium]|nr:asparagine synthase (glutamine-hydrolyzing) [Gammaproteobacteria bacterium]
MCGIAGFLDRSATDAGAAAARVERMSDTLAHRGPDDRGAWTDPREGVALGHRRLSVIDLSAAGHQPMTSPAGRYVIVYNGEIYNFRELRDSLDGVNWRGESDTEVLLALIERDGVEAALGRCAGMFAFALWDRQERCLWLARDRMGEKPLYYGWLGQTLVFASELKAIRAHPDFKGEIDRDALTLFLRHNYIPAPHSVYRGIRKLPPGHFLRLPWPTDAKREFPSRAYWSLREIADRAIPDRARQRDPQVALEELEQTLRLSVGQMMIADVPVGALLSGGIDSTLVTALMQSQHRQPVRTFTIGFNESDYDEAQYARAIAGHLGTDHHELYLGPADARAIIPELPALYDEP